MTDNEPGYGTDDNSYLAAGELAGITQLVEAFYDNMESFPEAQKIRAMHPTDSTESRKKLAYFLSGWLGGPKRYHEHYGSISIPGFHRHLDIGEAEHDAWLLCMKQAIADQPFEPAFQEYLYAQLCVPAGRVKQAVAARRDA